MVFIVSVNQIFVNLPVKNLDKSIAFWKSLGFKFNPKFTDKNAGCLILGKNMYSMLLTEKFFNGFLVKRELCDTKKSIETLTALQLSSKRAVDNLLKKAFENGAKEFRPISDLGFMYSGSFVDLDGHVWEPFYMK